MPQIPFWKLSRAERAAAFDNAFSQMQPADPKATTAKAQLRLIRTLIVKKRAEGYNHEQIATALKDPSIGLDVTPTYIRVILREAAQQREKRRKARVAATIAAAQRLSAPGPAANKPAAASAPKA